MRRPHVRRSGQAPSTGETEPPTKMRFEEAEVTEEPTVEQVMEAMDAADDQDELVATLIAVLAKARMMGVTREELIKHVEDAMR